MKKLRNCTSLFIIFSIIPYHFKIIQKFLLSSKITLIWIHHFFSHMVLFNPKISTIFIPSVTTVTIFIIILNFEFLLSLVNKFQLYQWVFLLFQLAVLRFFYIEKSKSKKDILSSSKVNVKKKNPKKD